ncbi:MAG: hypothetical protein QOK40_650 [Miltoncostaeaceae bacterium]|nr:hypothetical protein [Miltoncostaeaceae bacterium]
MFRKAGAHVRANVIGYVALFVALGGTAVAATTGTPMLNGDPAGGSLMGSYPDPVIGRGTVGPAELADGAVGTAKLDPLAKAPDADKVDGMDSTSFLQTGGKATDADRLDGIDSTSFLRTTGKATDADRLDGIDSTSFQLRVFGGCALGSSIQAVGSTGSVVCNAGPAAFSTFDDDTGSLCNSPCAEGTLSLPAGLYAITAKLEVFQNAARAMFVVCRLTAGSDVDRSEFDNQAALAGTAAMLPFQLVHAFGSPGLVSVSCTDFGVGDVRGHDLKITATRLGSLSNVPSNVG